MDVKKQIIDNILLKLSKSKFRSSFKLNEENIKYCKKVGLGKIKEHAYTFIDERLDKGYIENDGKQTPMKGHPVFIAQHATATCCRTCMEKWHNIKKGKELSQNEKNYIVYLILYWIMKEIKIKNNIN